MQKLSNNHKKQHINTINDTSFTLLLENIFVNINYMDIRDHLLSSALSHRGEMQRLQRFRILLVLLKTFFHNKHINNRLTKNLQPLFYIISEIEQENTLLVLVVMAQKRNLSTPSPQPVFWGGNDEFGWVKSGCCTSNGLFSRRRDLLKHDFFFTLMSPTYKESNVYFT